MGKTGIAEEDVIGKRSIYCEKRCNPLRAGEETAGKL